MSKIAVDIRNHKGTDSSQQLVEAFPQWLDQAPLCRDIERLCDPGEDISENALLNLSAKYFFSFLYPGAQTNPVPPFEIGQRLRMFTRCRSLNEPGDDIETMNLMRRFAVALSLAGEPEVAARVLRALLAQRLEIGSGRFLGLDIYAGAGLLTLGQYVLARRSGYSQVEAWGIEEDSQCAERAGALLRSLGAGNVAFADPSAGEAYKVVGGRNVCLVTTSATAGVCASLCDRRFFGAYAALFNACGPALDRASFFPEGLIAFSREANVSLILSRENGFQRPPEFEGSDLQPQGWIVGGNVLPLHRLAGESRSILG
ncbi:MAG: hypothetical protein V3573_05175 [Desulfovibrionaceae bacterium]